MRTEPYQTLSKHVPLSHYMPATKQLLFMINDLKFTSSPGSSKPEFHHELISPRVFLLDYVDLDITI